MYKKWTEEELTKLVELKQNNTSYDEIASILGRTTKSVRNKIFNLGLANEPHKKWSEEEDYLLIKNLDTLSHAEIAIMLGRTKNSVSGRVSYLSLSHKRWSGEEDSLLIENLNTFSLAEIAIMLGRTRRSVSSRVSHLGLTKDPHKKWTEEELDILTKLRREGSSAKEIAVYLGRTEASVYSKAFSLGLDKKVELWSEQEDIYLIDNYKNNSIEELSNSLGRSISSITTRAHILGIKKGKFKSNEQFSEELTNKFPHLEVIGRYTHSKVGVLVRNKICNHEYDIVPKYYLNGKISGNCPICTPRNISSGEIELREYLKTLNIEFTNNNRKILNGKELDIFIPDYLLGLEYNGEYWHSDKFKNHDNLHIKTTLANNAAIDLIHIFEHEWKEKNAIVKSRLAGILGLNQKIFARKTALKTINWTEAKEFLDRCHLQSGGSPTKINLGLYLGEELVALMTFGKPRFNANYEYELVRYCSTLNTNVIGGASKLLKHFIINFKPRNIISYSDRRWGRGLMYKKLGFNIFSITYPNYFYIKGLSRLSRYDTQKHKLEKLIPKYYDPDKTESEMMSNAGYYRCFDCGNYTWSLIV